jgi:hypothetical protein
MIYWPNDGRMHFDNPKARVQGIPAWGKRAISVRLMGKLPVTIAHGDLFEQTIANVVPNNETDLAAIGAFSTLTISLGRFERSIRKSM